MESTWESRDLPVLKAVVAFFDKRGRGPRASTLESELGFDNETVQRALRALYTRPYFEKGLKNAGGQVIIVGAPTDEALRLAGQWPTPEGQLERMVTALEAAANDEGRDEEERSRFRQAILTLRGAAYQVAIGALGGAGGNMLTG